MKTLILLGAFIFSTPNSCLSIENKGDLLLGGYLTVLL